VTAHADFSRLLADAKAGHGSALGELFHDLHPRLVRYLRVLEPLEADDLASDTWLDVAAALRWFEGDERALRALAFTTARRRLTQLRDRYRRPRSVEPERFEADAPGDEEGLVSSLSTDVALARVATLPQEHAEVVLLRVLGELPVEDVAEIVAKRPSVVRTIQHEALLRLSGNMMAEGVPA
jgi:RNA polymerase sigma-70 factor (ECF subfamily)